jgi:phosphatidylglycerol:prolipoprotein diacylglycerol transferase
MIPQIFQIGPIPVNSFGLMVALSLLVGIYSMQRSFRLYGLNPLLAENYVLTAGLTGIIGARLLYMLENFQEIQHDIIGALFSSAGFTFYGGFILATIVLIIKSKRDKIPLNYLAAATAPAIALGYAVGRLGCQLSGDGDYGMPTDTLLGMSYASGVIPTPQGVFVYPTPLYESTISILIAIYLYKLEQCSSARSTPLKIFSLALILLSLERFFVEFLRINPKLLWGLSEAQLIATFLAIIGIVIYLVGNKSSPQLKENKSI